MKGNKILALIALCALAVPSGFAVAAEPLVTGVTAQGSIDGNSGAVGQISLIQQTLEDADAGYLANIKSGIVTHAKLSWNQDAEAIVEVTPEGLAKDKFFAVADNKEVTISAEKAEQTEVHKVKFNYVPTVKEHETQATAVIGKAFTLDLTEVFEDKDGDAMTFSYRLNDDKDKTAIDSSEFTYTPTQIGTDSVEFFAEDAGAAADKSISATSFRMQINVQNDALITSLSFSYPGVDNISLSPRFDSATDQYVLNVPDDIPYVVPGMRQEKRKNAILAEIIM